MNYKLLVLGALLCLCVPATQGAPYYPGASYAPVGPIQGRGMGPPWVMPQTQRPSQRPTQAKKATTPEGLLKEGVGKLIGFIRQARSQGQPINPPMAMAFLDQEIAPYFDFGYMAKVAAGPIYSRLNDRQKVHLENKLKTRFLTTLARNLGSYSDQQIRYLPPRMSADGKELDLNVWLMQAQGYPTKLRFRLYRSAQGWKVFDVVANNTSAVIYYRNYLRRTMQRQGPGWLTG